MWTTYCLLLVSLLASQTRGQALHPDIRANLDVVGANPGGRSWADSYSSNGRCYCAFSTFDHGIRTFYVETRKGTTTSYMTVESVCDLLGQGPGITDDTPLYNDVQCGNGPPNDAGDEQTCPGRVDIGPEGCGQIGPKWDFSDVSLVAAEEVQGVHPDITAVVDVVGANPGGLSWADSYSVNGRCYCSFSTFDHGIGTFVVETGLSATPFMTVKEVCDLLGAGPGITDETPLYNDVQCGNGPPNDAGDEDTCPGRVDIGPEGCGQIGPKWDFSDFAPPPAVVCFSGSSTVEIRNKGVIHMKDLQLGDEVLVDVDTNKFDLVYSFGHREVTQNAAYLQFLPSGIEISADHMVHLGGKEGRIVPASLVQVGDSLLPSSDLLGTFSVVEEIRNITRRGAYAPFTMSGTIVVNKVMASCYVSMQPDQEALFLGHVETPFTHHWLAHISQSWHRMYINFFGVDASETSTDAGLSNWISVPYQLSSKFVMQQENGFVALLIFMMTLPLLLLGYAGEFILGYFMSW